jgi:hypothetical protein
MKRVLLLGALFCLNLAVKAQKVYFIYLQSETSTPFYVKMAGKIQSSTTNGYLILSKLVDSTYLITIGQPGKQEEPRFTVTISRGDRGFLIKNIEGTLGLFDLQTLAIYKPVNTETTAAMQTVSRNDNFTKLLAKAADDSTLLSQPVVQQNTPKPKEVKPEEAVVKETVAIKQDVAQPTVVTAPTTEQPQVMANKDTVVKENSATVSQESKPEVKKEEPAQPVQEDYKKSIVIKKSETANTEGLGITFVDTFNEGVDTIEITIPNQKTIVIDTPQKQATQTKQFLEITNVGAEKADKDVKPDTVTTKAPEPSATAKVKSQCVALATDDDFFKLRRDMATGKNDDEMIAQAKKYFKSKCYRTEQIKYLSTLFLTDESKYQFFDVAYRHVSDQEKFRSLQSEIQDSYYVNRFKALIGN